MTAKTLPAGAGLTRRQLLATASSLAGASALPAFAQGGYPSRQMRWIVPYNAGGATDIVSRLLAEAIQHQTGQRVIVDNKPGAATKLGMQDLLASPADGYTMATADNGTLYNNWTLFDKLPYTPASFEYVAMTGRFPLVLVVHESVPAHSLQEWVQWVRKNQGKVNYATPGVGSPHHIAMATLEERYGLQMQHVPYKGDSAAVVDVMAGVVPTMLVGVANARQHMTDKRLRMLAVTWPTRLSSLPDVPTFEEGGLKDFEVAAEQGVLMPAGTPKDVVARFNREIAAALSQQAIRDKLETVGMYPVIKSPEEFKAYVQKQAKAAGEVIKRKSITIS